MAEAHSHSAHTSFTVNRFEPGHTTSDGTTDVPDGQFDASWNGASPDAAGFVEGLFNDPLPGVRECTLLLSDVSSNLVFAIWGDFAIPITASEAEETVRVSGSASAWGRVDGKWYGTDDGTRHLKVAMTGRDGQTQHHWMALDIVADDEDDEEGERA